MLRPHLIGRPGHAASGSALAVSLFVSMSSPAAAQMKVVAGHSGVEVVEKEDGRFIASLEGGAPSSASGVETHALFDGFELKLQWWTLLGEPIEYYDILWRSTDHYEIEAEDCPPAARIGTRCRISRGDLAAYPDLLKRFDALRPIRMYVRVDGSFYGLDIQEHGRSEILEPLTFHDPGSRLNTDPLYAFSYIVTDPKLLITRSGKMGSGIVPGSPRDWEHFLQYREHFPMGAGVSARENYGLNGVGDATEAAKESRRRVLQRVFQEARSVALTARVTHLEWPEVEMRSIAAKLDRYESGEEEPSPLEEVAAAREEVESTGPYQGDDFWGSPPEPLSPDVEVFDSTFQGADGREFLYGLRDRNTGQVLLDPQPRHLSELTVGDMSYWLRRVSGGALAGPLPELELLDARGRRVLPQTYNNLDVYSSEPGILRATRILEWVGPCRRAKRWVSGFRPSSRDARQEIVRFDPRLNVVEREVRATTIRRDNLC